MVRGCEYSVMLNYFNEQNNTLQEPPFRYNERLDCFGNYIYMIII